jgi:hypothetical protein
MKNPQVSGGVSLRGYFNRPILKYSYLCSKSPRAHAPGVKIKAKVVGIRTFQKLPPTEIFILVFPANAL